MCMYMYNGCDSVTLLVYFAVVPGPFVIPTTTSSPTGTLLMIPTGLYDLFSTFSLFLSSKDQFIHHVNSL